MRRIIVRFIFSSALISLLSILVLAAIPLPEHPRPDFERADWINLNGSWSFQFDKENAGVEAGWQKGTVPFRKTITVPFPWGSQLSGVENEADIAWYQRPIEVPKEWAGKRVFLVVGASDWLTAGWLEGEPLGNFRGGYTPFEFELTRKMKPGQPQSLVLRVDDTPHPFKLEGKQGYGPAKGVWQTIYLEARPEFYLDSLQFLPDIDRSEVKVRAFLNQPATLDLQLQLRFTRGGPEKKQWDRIIVKGSREVEFVVPIPHAILWTLEDPFLHEVEVSISGPQGKGDRVSSYFGMRKISVIRLPGTNFPYVALNNKPIYLQMTLDQAYHPEGFYTFPSDSFMRDEILRSRRIGLNAMRVHVKIEIPRKLFWADKLGMLIMADIPNSWGEPNQEMRQEVETAWQGMVRRDFNHPSIFCWVLFNETWGLFTNDKYLPETQAWVVSLYRKAKSMDPTRLVEDQSPCNNDHTETDLNSWHVYLPGYAWKEHLEKVVRDTGPGSAWNFIGGRKQAEQPLLNSECGNVWGYEGSAGNVDWSWDYHIMMNEFRRQPKIGGWLYTEHHDVINEWNGYYRYDRSEKYTGLEELVPGMTLKDLHSPFYISTGNDLCRSASPEEKIQVPLWASFMTGQVPPELTLRTSLYGWNDLGRFETYAEGKRQIAATPWMSRELPSLELTMPARPSIVILALSLENPAGLVLQKNFTTFRVDQTSWPRDETLTLEGRKTRIVRFGLQQAVPAIPGGINNRASGLTGFSKEWWVLSNLKRCGTGAGNFSYSIPWPEGLRPDQIESASILVEASAKRLNGKDKTDREKQEGDFMRGKGTHDPSANPNSYPMTDTTLYPSAVRVLVNEYSAGVFDLPDDPADHRGILSWHAQLHNKRLSEAGSYGYMIQAAIPAEAWTKAEPIQVRFAVDDSLPGGLALYGKDFGRYPLDPTILFVLKK